MTTPGGGGDRLDVEVVADASGFARGLQAKLDAETRDIRAKIQAEVDATRLRQQLDAAARSVSTGNAIRLQLAVDRESLRRSVDAAIADMNTRDYKIQIGVDIDTARIQAALDEATHARTASVEVDADTSRAREEIDAFREEEKHRPAVEVPVKAKPEGGGSSSDDPFKSISGGLEKIGSPLTAVTGLLGNFTSILMGAAAIGAPGLLAIAAAASTAVGVIGALPAVAAMAGMGLGVLMAGFSGISKAVSALSAADTGGAQQAQQAANQRIMAQQAVAAATQHVADVAQSSSLSIAQGEQQVASAQHNALLAQQSLTQARLDAQQKLRDYRLELSGAALNEKQAQLDIEQQSLSLKQTLANPASTDLQRRQAELALEQAQQHLAEVQQTNSDLQQQATKDQKLGVNGNLNVVAAQYAVGQANQGVDQSQAALARTRIQAVRDEANAQQSLANAERTLQQTNASLTSSQTALNAAMKQLSPAGQEFVRWYESTLKPALSGLKKGIQEALLPPIQAGIQAAMPILGTLKTGLEGTATVIGNTIKQAGVMMGSPAFRADTATIMASNNRAMGSFGQAGISVLSILKDLAVAAGPLVERFAKWVEHLAAAAQAATATGRESGKLEAFFQRAGDTVAKLGKIFGNTFGGLFDLLKAGAPTGQGLLDYLVKLTQRFKDFASSTTGQADATKFFKDLSGLMPQVLDVLTKIVAAVGNLAKNGSSGSELHAVLDIAQFLAKALDSMAAGPLSSLINAFIIIGGSAALLSGPVGKIGSMIDGVKSLVGFGGKVVDFTKGLKGGADAAADIGTKAAGAGAKVRSAASSVMGFIDDSGRKIASWGSAAGGKIADLGSKVGDLATAFLESGKKAIVAGARWLAAAASSTVDAIAGAATAVWDVAAALAANVVEAGAAAIAWAADAIAAGAAAIADGALTIAEWLLNAALWANPITWIVALIVGLIVVIVLLITNTWGLRDKMVAAFEWIRDKVVAAFEWIGSKLKAAWSAITGWINFGKFRDDIIGAFNWVRDKVIGAFNDLKSGASRIWSDLKKALRDPLDAIINVVYNNGVVPVWNWINDLWGGTDLKPYHLPQFSVGGVLDGYAPGQDTRLVRMSPGEGVLVPEAVQGIGGRAGVQALNSHFSSRVAGPGLKGGLPAFQGGGVLDTIGGWASGAWNGATNAVGSAWNATTGFVGGAWDKLNGLIAQGWKIAVHAATQPIRAAARMVPGDGSMATGLRDGVGQWMDKLEAAVGAKEDKHKKEIAAQAGNVSGGAAQWAPLVARALAELGQSQDSLPWVLKLIDHESSGNPRAINLTDVNALRGDPSRGLMQTIGSTFNAYAGPYRSAGIYDPYANIYAGLSYGASRYGSVMAIPGIASLASGGGYKPYDTGGRFPNNSSGYNTSGADEGVLTGKGVAALGGWARLDALNAGRPLAELVGASAGASARPRDGQSIGTYIAEGAVQQTIHNPVPETTEETLNTRMRRLGELGIFGGGPS